MPEIKNCKKCKRLIQYVGGPQLCEDCKKVEEEDFERVRKFIRDFPGTTINEVSTNTEVSAAQIHKYIRDGLIEIASDSPIAIQCENCGARIRSGRFCVECSKKLAKNMIEMGKQLVEDKKKDQAVGFRSEDNGLRYKNKEK